MVDVTFQTNTVTVTGSTVTVSTSQTVNSVSRVDGAKSLADLTDVDLTGRIDESLHIFDQASGAFSTASGTTTSNLGTDGGDF